MGRMFGAPFHVVGLGIGPLTDPDAKRMAGFIADHAQSIMVRDAESAALAAEICPDPSRVRQAPDTVYALELPSRPEIHRDIAALRKRGYRIIGLNLRPWAHTDEEALRDTLARVLVHHATGEPIAIVGVPMQAGERLDTRVLASVCALVQDSVPALILRAPLTTDELVSALASIDVLVSMRLHACLLAHRLGKPVVGIAYDPKVANHFGELGRSDVCLELPLDSATLARALGRAMGEGVLPQGAIDRIRALEAEAAAALVEICAAIAAEPTRKVVHEIPRIDLEPSPPAPVAPLKPVDRQTQALSWRLSETVYATAGLLRQEDIAPRANTRSLSVWLPSTRPTLGDAMEISSTIDIEGQGDVELALSLIYPYTNARAVGRLRISLEIGGQWRLAQDLASSAAPIQVRVFCNAPCQLPVRLQLHVVRNCFSSMAWPRVSRVELRVDGLTPSAHGCQLRILSSGGVIRELPTPDASAPPAAAGG
jgi:polysaccharide pyruvyl transferase WcaK-like protein